MQEAGCTQWTAFLEGVLVVNSCSWSSEGIGSHFFSPSFKCKLIHCTNKSERRNDQAYLGGLQLFTLQRSDAVHQPQNRPPLQSRFALPGANIDLIFRGIQFIFGFWFVGFFSPSSRSVA